MVFESYVVDILNRFLGQYVKNLDSSQLKIGIWGGDVKLENLELKESALDDLDLPVKVLRGNLGRLVLKIPWKNLYSEAVVASIEGVYLLVRPNEGLKYNAEKEEHAKQEKKKRQLEAIEEARKREEEKNKAPKDEKSDSFTEKLAMHIIKNIQVSIEDIHVRYEDNVTTPSAPFSIGISLENLSMQSTDENWKPCLVKDAVQIVNKLVRLDSLALYWNTRDNIGEVPSGEQWLNMAKSGVATRRTAKHFTPNNFRYILEPISAVTKMKLNLKPGTDLDIPKALVNIILEEIGLVLARKQYQDLMELVEGFDRMATNSAFRKYKPDVPLHGNAKKWWKYAMSSILEEDVRRRMRMWSWKHIKQHRDSCKEYKNLYKEKLSQKSPSDALLKSLELFENQLDVVNITICRQKAEMENKHEGLQRKHSKKIKEKNGKEKKSGGWMSGWFGGSKKTKAITQGEPTKPEPELAITEEQKKEELDKLFSAIGYSESEVVTAFPKEYVENKLVFLLRNMTITLRDEDPDGKLQQVTKLSLTNLYAEIKQRPSAKALSVHTKMDGMTVFGSPDENGVMQIMVSSQRKSDDMLQALFKASFEINPLDSPNIDQKLDIVSQPLEIIYDAETVNQIAKFFTLPQDVRLQELSLAALSTFEELKSYSRSSLVHAIESHKVMDVNIDLKSPHIIIPEGGRMRKSCSVLVMDLGHIKLQSDVDKERNTSTKDLSLVELESKCYDRFTVHLEALQVLLASSSTDWRSARKQNKSELHILYPCGFDVSLHKAVNANDPRLAQIKLFGTLPSLHLHVNDAKISNLIKLALSIPLPENEPTTESIKYQSAPLKVVKTQTLTPALTLLTQDDDDDDDDDKEKGDDDDFTTPPDSPVDLKTMESSIKGSSDLMSSQVKLQLKFELQEILISVDMLDKQDQVHPCLSLSVQRVGTYVTMKEWEMNADASIGSISLQEMSYGEDDGPLHLLHTPEGSDLFTAQYTLADKASPEFHTRFQSTEQSVIVKFAALNFVLHQEALLRIMEFAQKVTPESLDSPPEQAKEKQPKEQGAGDSKISAILAKSGSKKPVGDVKISLQAEMGGFDIRFTSVQGDLSFVHIKGLRAQVVVTDDRTDVTASMKDLSVTDPLPGALYPKIVSIVNDDVFNVEVNVYNNATSGANYTNMELVDTIFKMKLGCVRVVFINRFVMALLAFFNRFQIAKDALELASKAAAVSASATMLSLQQQSSRTQLNVLIQAPLVIIPISSQSTHALVADLGQVTVLNKFDIAQAGKDPSGLDTVIVENMSIILESLKLSRAIIHNGEKIVAQRLIIEPVSLWLGLYRSLAAGWTHQIPDLDITGTLEAIKLSVGPQDLQSMLAVLAQNLTEGKELIEESEPQPTHVHIIDTSAAASNVPATQDVVAAKTSEDMWTTLKFAFEIGQVSASVYRKEKPLTSQDESSWVREPSHCLGTFALEKLSLSGTMFSDTSLSVSVGLETCVLDDMRPGSEKGLARMMDRFIMKTGETDNDVLPCMIDVKFNQDADQNKQIVVGVQNLHIIVNVEFLLVLSDVFMSALNAEDTSVLMAGDASTKAPSVAPTTVDEEQPDLSVQLKVTNPEIVLLADAKDRDTNALFLHNSVDFKILMTGGQQKMCISVCDLSMMSAAFDEDKRAATRSQVLNISHLSLLSSAPIGGRQHINMNTSVINMNVSPATIRTITAVLMSLAPTKEEESADHIKASEKDLFGFTDLKPEDRWYLNPVPEDQIVLGSIVWSLSSVKNKYLHGYVARMDSRIHIAFDIGEKIAHDINDSMSVVLDRDPDPKDIHIGMRVISFYPTSKKYHMGTVCEIDVTDVENPKYYVCQSDGDTVWATQQQLRPVPLVRPGGSLDKIIPSRIVWARVGKEASFNYFLGFIIKIDTHIHVKFYNSKMGQKVYDLNDIGGIVLESIPTHDKLPLYTRVIGPWRDNEYRCIGRIIGINHDDPSHIKYTVQHDDQCSANNTADELRVVKMKRDEVGDGEVGLGSQVWGLRSDGNYHRAFVSLKRRNLHVKFIDGGRCVYRLDDIGGRVIIDYYEPRDNKIKIGSSVIGWNKAYDRYYPATVVQKRRSDQGVLEYHLSFDDGEDKWLSALWFKIVEDMKSAKELDDTTVEDIWDLRGDQLVMEVEGLSLKVEAIIGGRLVPMISLDATLNAEVKDWMAKMTASAGLCLEATYYNESLAEWEPLIEPVESHKGQRPWELQVKFVKEDDDADEEEASLDIASAPPLMSVDVTSEDTLQMTMTQTCIDVLTKLGTAFSEAVMMEGSSKPILEEQPPYEIRNELGLDVKISPGTTFEQSKVNSEGFISVAAGSTLPLQFVAKNSQSSQAYFQVKNLEANMFHEVKLQVDGFHVLKSVPVKRARSVFYTLIPLKLLQGTTMSLVVEVEASEGQRVITLRSPLQIHNHFPIPLDICLHSAGGSGVDLERISTVEPNTVYNVPLMVSYFAGLYFKPAGFDYRETSEPLVWMQFAQPGASSRRVLQCRPPMTAEQQTPFYIEIDCKKATYAAIHGVDKHSPCYVMHCYPSVVLHNYLPYALFYKSTGIPRMNLLNGGEHWPLFSAKLEERPILDVQLQGYENNIWSGQVVLRRDLEEHTTLTMSSTRLNESGKSIEFGVYTTRTAGCLNITIYSAYWLVNKTGVPLEYKPCDDESVIFHPPDMEEAILFSFKKKSSMTKRTVRARMPGSDWSNKFSLDAIASGGALKWKNKGVLCEVGLEIRLSHFSLTKIVLFTPLHLLVNNTDVAISMAESKVSDKWFTAEPGECVPFWPSTSTPNGLMIKVGGNQRISAKFDYVPDELVLLKVDHSIGGVCVDMQNKDAAEIITFSRYFDGAAVARIENQTQYEICYKQSGTLEVYHLLPGLSVLYSWDEPTGKQEFSWFPVGESLIHTSDLKSNKIEKASAGEETFHCVTFLDGLQRVMLFTDSFTLAYRAGLDQVERVAQSISLSIQGVGLSLVNNDKMVEVAYVGITQSATVWEISKKRRWKAFNIKTCDALEEAWSKVQKDIALGADPMYVQKIGEYEVDFEFMDVVSPAPKRKLRRTFNPGVYFEYNTSPHQTQLHAKVNSVQIDSQVPGGIFQTVLFPIPPPKSLAAENAPKPFLETCIIILQGHYRKVNQFKYFKTLIQEMDVKVDIVFLTALIEMFTSGTTDSHLEATNYEKDKTVVAEKLGKSAVVQAASQDIFNYFEYFHLSPLKVHVSFSLEGGTGEGGGSLAGNVIGLLLKSVGVAITNVQDVEFKFAFFEATNTVFSQEQMTGAVIKHYSSQGIKQLYVLVLGLDVLGNPFGLIRGLKTGATDFFYEPYQGLIQGPGEFAEGVFLGVKSLLGHTVGGAAGAASRITGTLGKGLAALTMDNDYQNSRRQNVNKKPTNIKEGLSRGGKGLVQGMFHGVTGIVTKPIEGAEKGGTSGFFKGLGKGLVGVVARPASGIVDFASSTLEGIKGTAAGSVAAVRLRPPRVFYADNVIKPYNSHEAEGSTIIKDVTKGKNGLEEDKYCAHVVISTKRLLMATNRNVLLVEKAEVFRNWTIEWILPFKAMESDTTSHGNQIIFKVIDKSKGVFKRVTERSITVNSPSNAQWMANKINQARKAGNG